MTDDPWAAFLAPPGGAANAAADPWSDFSPAAHPGGSALGKAPHVEATPAPTAPEQPSVAADVAKSGAVGVAKGGIGLGGLAGDVQEMGGSLIDRGMLWLGHKAMNLTGFGPQEGTPERERFDRMYLNIGSGGGLPTSAQIKSRVEDVTGPFYEPKTTAGHYAERFGEFAPAAVVGPGGIMRKIVETAVPAFASEAAGQATKGTKLEPVARLGGALAGGLGTAAVAARADAPARAIAAATRGTEQRSFEEARALAATGQRLGIPLTGPEAINAATGNGTKLGDLQRTVEGSLQGGSTLARFYSDRPERMRSAAETVFDTIAPQSAAPSTLGPRAAQAAADELDALRQSINRTTAADYRAAGSHVLDPADFEPIARDPAFQASLRRLRSDEVLGPAYAGHSDASVAVIDAVTKDMRDRGVALGNRMNPGFSSQAAGMYGSGAAEARSIARDPARGGSAAYDEALNVQRQAREQNLTPQEQGPLGRLAAATDTHAAGDIVLPANPHVGGTDELVNAVTRASRREPDVVAQLVRQRLADQFDAGTTRLVGGEAQGGGARFAKDVAGRAQQQANLDAILAAVERGRPPGPSPRQEMGDLISVLRATGTRKPQGSPTDFNAQIRETVGEMPLTAQAITAAKTGGASLLTSAGDAARRAYLGRNNATLADLFTAPDSVDRIGAIVRQGLATPYADAVMRAGIQGQGAQ